MPVIKFETGQVSKEQKEKLIAGFTDVASEATGIKREHFYVLIKENGLENWGVGGEMLSEIFAKNPNF
jgi:4-oxalocrotonate tautomerase